MLDACNIDIYSYLYFNKEKHIMPEKEDLYEDAQVVDNNDDAQDQDQNHDQDHQDQDETEERDVSPTALQKLEASVAQLENFTSVDQVKQFCIQLGIPGRPEDNAQKMIRGRELNLKPMQAFDHIYMINGRATLSVHAVNYLLKRSGYEISTLKDNVYIYNDGTEGHMVIEGKTIARICTIEASWKSKLTGAIKTEQYTYSWAEATAAGLTGKDTWKKYGKQLLWARTLVFLARRIAAEALMGFYETSEIADVEGTNYTVNDSGNAIPI